MPCHRKCSEVDGSEFKSSVSFSYPLHEVVLYTAVKRSKAGLKYVNMCKQKGKVDNGLSEKLE